MELKNRSANQDTCKVRKIVCDVSGSGREDIEPAPVLSLLTEYYAVACWENESGISVRFSFFVKIKNLQKHEINGYKLLSFQAACAIYRNARKTPPFKAGLKPDLLSYFLEWRI
jgi:hypothetical protein